MADRARNDQPGSGQERPAGLTEKDNCGPVACARVRAKDQSEVDPQQIKAGPDEQETVNTHGTFEELGGRTEVTSKEQLDQSMAKAPVGTKVVVWVWKAGDKAAHLVYGEKARDGTHYYDSDSRAPLTKADADAALADAQAVTVFGGGTAFRGGKASGPESVPSLPRYVGAGAVRADPMAARRFATARDGAESPSRPDVIAVRNPDGTFSFRPPEPPAKTAPAAPPVDYVITARPGGGWKVTTRPVSERPAWLAKVPLELPAQKDGAPAYAPEPPSPWAQSALNRMTARGGEVRQAVGAAVLFAMHVLAPDAAAAAPQRPFAGSGGRARPEGSGLRARPVGRPCRWRPCSLCSCRAGRADRPRAEHGGRRAGHRDHAGAGTGHR